MYHSAAQSIVKFGPLLLALGCGASAPELSPPSPAPFQPSPELARAMAGSRLAELENSVRLPLYNECGGDAELRCQQFASKNYRGIVPVIPVRALRCDETGVSSGRIRTCVFVVGRDGAASAECRLTLWERIGEHSRYWSDNVPAPPLPENAGDADTASVDSVDSVATGRSSLHCSKPLLALTEPAERVVRNPAMPPRPLRDLAILFREDWYEGPPLAAGRDTVTSVRLRVGSHGRVDTCTVTRSSGSSEYDSRTCTLLRTSAYFEPARNKKAKPVATMIAYSHDWRLPREGPRYASGSGGE